MTRLPCAAALLLATGLLPGLLQAQPSSSDTLKTPLRDSTAGRDTSGAAKDTVRASASSSGIDSVVTYTAADSVVYSLSQRTMFLFGKGNVAYRELALRAQNIDINWTTSLLNARGTIDTSDTTGTQKLKGLPELIDGAETYHGETIAYNFKSKKGKINLGKTEIEKGLYYGEEIKKVESNVLFVEDGEFTTCELDHPHFYFGSPEMKVNIKENIVGRPVFLYISDVPVFALPFGIFPSERGRRPGFIPPAFGSSYRGRYLTHFGYYWPISDYMDFALKADGYTKGGYVLYGDYQYALRYNFSGALSGSFGRSVTGEPGDPGYQNLTEFNVRWYHNQDFSPSTKLLVDFTFSSNSYYQNTSNNLSELLRQNIVSNATLTKSWEGPPNSSLTMNIRRDQNLETGQTSTILPNIGFNMSQSFPFRAAKRSATGLAWFELIGFSYSGQLLDVLDKIPVYDTPGGPVVSYSYDQRAGLLNQASVNASPKLGYVSITPFFNYTEKWYHKRTEESINPASGALVTSDVKAFTAVRYYNLGISAQTKFFGIFQPNVFGIKGIRHQVTPSVSYTYQPDFAQPAYGYYGTYIDTNGVQQRYGKYDREVFGGAPAGKQEAVSFNIGNVFEMKTASGDTAGEDNKFQLLNLNAGISYNFAADSLRFSELGLDFRTSVGQYLSIGGTSRFNLYKFETDPNNPLYGRRVNKFLLNEEGRLADLTSFGISIGTRLSGEKKKTTAGPERSPADSLGRKAKSGYVGLYDQEAPDFSIPWNLDLNFNFNRDQSNPNNTFINSGLSVGLGFNLTPFWKINAVTSYDLINRVFTAPQIVVYRDLHCWELNFNWVPTGPYRNFRVEIKLKSPMLQDVKVTKQGSARNVF